mgnify:CR=1 FL=1
MTTSFLEIRKMIFDDLVFVNNVRNSKLTRHMLEDSREISLEETERWFLSKNPEWFVIESNDQPVGYIRTSDNTGKSICIGCDIDPDQRRKGFAKKAYEKFISNLYAKGFVNIWLDVFRENEPALNLYRKLGFFEIGSRSVRSKEYVTMVHKRGTN